MAWRRGSESNPAVLHKQSFVSNSTTGICLEGERKKRTMHETYKINKYVESILSMIYARDGINFVVRSTVGMRYIRSDISGLFTIIIICTSSISRFTDKK